MIHRIVIILVLLLATIAVAQERFVPRGVAVAGGVVPAQLEVVSEATVAGPEVRLRQVCRWAARDAARFAAVAETVVGRLAAGESRVEIDAAVLGDVLAAAGISPAGVRISGASTISVRRSMAGAVAAGGGNTGDAAVLEWAQRVTTAAAPKAGESVPVPATLPAGRPAALDSPRRTLRERLTADVAERLALDPESVQIEFDPKDERLLNLSEPLFRFMISPVRVVDLGTVTWRITLTSETVDPRDVELAATRKVEVTAFARAWRTQLLAVRPIAMRQTLTAGDVESRKYLAERLTGDDSPALELAVGQTARQEFSPGAVVTSRQLEPTPLARAGQLVTVTLTCGTVQARTVGKALEAGCFGESIRVENQVTGETLLVTLTGPQEGRVGPVAPPAPQAVDDADADEAAVRLRRAQEDRYPAVRGGRGYLPFPKKVSKP